MMELESKEADERDLLEDVESYKKTCIQIEKLVCEIEQLKTEGEKCDVRDCLSISGIILYIFERRFMLLQ